MELILSVGARCDRRGKLEQLASELSYVPMYRYAVTFRIRGAQRFLAAIPNRHESDITAMRVMASHV